MSVLGSQSGAVAVVIAICMVMLIGFAALAIDVGHFFVVRNELKNSADAGALAGAAVLLNPDYTVNTSANNEAKTAALANISDGGSTIGIDYTSGNDPTKDIVRGHWSFTRELFTPEPSSTLPDGHSPTGPYDFVGKSPQELDDPTDPNFYYYTNAIRVITQRDPSLPGSSAVVGFLTGIFSKTTFNQTVNESIGYLGWAGSLGPGEVDAPIAMCREALLNDQGEYDCTVGRMFSDSSDLGDAETAAWTSFDQPSCSGASRSAVAAVLPCTLSDANPGPLDFGQAMESTNGVTSTFPNFKDCWETAPQDHDGDDQTAPVPLDSDGINGPDQSLELTLPVVTCATHPCYPLVGAVTMRIMWVLNQASTNVSTDDPGTPGYAETPMAMDGWICSLADPTNPAYVDGNRDNLTPTQRQTCWNEFVGHFNISREVEADDSVVLAPATYETKTIYFLPSCTPQEPRGTSGGGGFGILADIPVLVK